MKALLADRRGPFFGLVIFALVSPISIAATNAAWVITLLLWGYRAYQERPRPRDLFPKTELNAGFGIFLLASFLSVWASLDLRASVVEFRSLGLMVIHFLFCWNIEGGEERKRLVFCLVGATIVAALFGILQHTTGWDYTGHYDPASGKAGSFFGLHLTFGEYLVLTTCLVGGLVLFGNLSVPLRLAGVGVSMLLMIGIVASGSKGSVLGFVAGALALLGLRGRRTLVGLCVAVLIAGAVVFTLKSWDPVHNILFQFQVNAQETDGPMASNTRRLYMWWSGLRISAHHLLTGIGLHAMESVYPAFRHPMALEPNQWHLHNQYIQIGVTRGLFGLTGLIYILAAAFRACLRRFRFCRDPWDRGIAAGVLAGLSGFLVCGLTEYCWGDSEVLMLVYMLLGLMVSIRIQREPGATADDGRKGPAHRSGRSLTRAGSLGLTFLLSGIVLVSFLVPVTERTLAMRVLEASLGCALLRLVARPLSEDEPERTRTLQAVACLTVYAVYTFTQHAWQSAEAFFLAEGMPSLTFATMAGTLAVLGGLLLWIARRRGAWAFFDLCVFASLALWGASAWGTGLLLARATGERGVLAPPLLVLVPLLTLVFGAYTLLRFGYGGVRRERVALFCVALGVVIHALR